MEGAIKVPLETALPFEAAANLLKTFGQHGAARVSVEVWLADESNGPAIEMRGFVNEVNVQTDGGEGRTVVLTSDDWHVGLNESRAECMLTCVGMIIAKTRDGNEVAIGLGLID